MGVAFIRHFRRRRRAGRLPDTVYAELVAMLFSMLTPVVMMGAALTLVGVLTALHWNDPLAGALTALAATLTAARAAVILAFRRLGAPLASAREARRWERRYAAGGLAFAAVLGAFGARAIFLPDPLLHMVAASLIFGFGAGLVARVSIRPILCVASLMLAVLPIAAAMAMAMHAGGSHNLLGAPVYGIEAMVVLLFALTSLETVRHLHQAAVSQLKTRHDLTFLARQDALTGLANRLSLRERFDASIAPVAGARHRLAVHFLDLDGFKAINDTHGHPAGDAVLKEVSRRLTAMVRGGDTVARIGGDEFVVVQAEIAHDGEAEMLARRIVRTLGAPYQVGPKSMTIGVSVGIALAPDHGLDLEQLAACADAALYRAKGKGKGRIVFCESSEARERIAAVA